MTKKGMTPKQAEKLFVKRGGGTKLRVLRVQKGLSQSELSELSGVSKKTIQRFEQQSESINGTNLGTLCDLCGALDCKIEDIIEGEELPEKYKKVR